MTEFPLNILDPNSPDYDRDLTVGAYYVNRFFVRMQEHRGRIAFGESMRGGEMQFHTAVQLDRSDLEELHRILGMLLDKSQPKDAERGSGDD